MIDEDSAAFVRGCFYGFLSSGFIWILILWAVL
jgi:hypothetical protein